MVENVDIGRFFELGTSNKIYVNNLNLHEIKNEILKDYTGDFELKGLMNIGHNELETNSRFKDIDHFERYIITIDVDYDSEDIIFTGYIYKLKTPQFNDVQGSAYGKRTNIMQKIVDYHGQICYIPTSGISFIKCIIYLTEKDYTEEFLTLFLSEQRRSNVMTSARMQPFIKKYDINIGCFDGTRTNLRNTTQRNTSLFIYNNHFCLIWKSDGVSFNQVIEH